MPYYPGQRPRPFLIHQYEESRDVDWTPTPAGSDLCELSDAVFEINMECIDRSNVGGLAGFNAVFGGVVNAASRERFFLQYDCANLDLSSYELLPPVAGKGGH